MLGMARLLFKLRHVEAEEFDEVTAALDAAGIAWYQTSGGLLGLGTPALWLREEAQFDQARAVIEGSQQARALRLRQQAQQARELGQATTFASQLRDDPVGIVGRLLLLLAIIAGVLAAPWLLWR